MTAPARKKVAAKKKVTKKRTTKKKAARRITKGVRVLAKRDSNYRPEFDDLACKCAMLGVDYETIGNIFGVSEKTVRNWIERHPSFGKAIRSGGALADAEVAKSLYMRATGYTSTELHEEYTGAGDDRKLVKTRTVTKDVAPDVAAIIFWITNRRRELWRRNADNNAPSLPDPSSEAASGENAEEFDRLDFARRAVFWLTQTSNSIKDGVKSD